MISAEEAINKVRWKRVFNENERHKKDEFINRDSRLVDINLLNTCNLPHNPSVSMPSALERGEEVRIQQYSRMMLRKRWRK